MKTFIEAWIKKYICPHEYEVKGKAVYTTHDRYLLVCRKCGKVKRVKV